MNIEESKNLLGWVSLNKLYIDTHNECDYHKIHTAIETLLTAYEKEKEKNEEYENMIINHKKQLKQAGIYGYDYDLEILKEE